MVPFLAVGIEMTPLHPIQTILGQNTSFMIPTQCPGQLPFAHTTNVFSHPPIFQIFRLGDHHSTPIDPWFRYQMVTQYTLRPNFSPVVFDKTPRRYVNCIKHLAANIR